jgi:hypothetical protein
MNETKHDDTNKGGVNTKYRTSSALLCLNKDYIKSARSLRKIANGDMEATVAQIKAMESILYLLLPYDPQTSG